MRTFEGEGILDIGEDTPVNLNGVYHIIHPPERLDEWLGVVSQAFMVFIAININPIAIIKSLEKFQQYISDVTLIEYQESV